MNKVQISLDETGHGSIIINDVLLKSTVGVQFISTPGGSPVVRLGALIDVEVDARGTIQVNGGSKRDPISQPAVQESIFSKLYISVDAFGHWTIRLDDIALTDVADIELIVAHNRPTIAMISFCATVDLDIPNGSVVFD